MPLNLLSLLYFCRCCCFCSWFWCLPSDLSLLSLDFTCMLLIFFALLALSHWRCKIRIPHRWKTKCRKKNGTKENKYSVGIHSFHSDFTPPCVSEIRTAKDNHFFHSPTNIIYIGWMWCMCTREIPVCTNNLLKRSKWGMFLTVLKKGRHNNGTKMAARKKLRDFQLQNKKFWIRNHIIRKIRCLRSVMHVFSFQNFLIHRCNCTRIRSC